MGRNGNLDVAARRISEGRDHIARQRRLIDALAGDHYSDDMVDEARTALDELERAQRLHEQHLAALLDNPG